jgi:hypothetical protein
MSIKSGGKNIFVTLASSHNNNRLNGTSSSGMEVKVEIPRLSPSQLLRPTRNNKTKPNNISFGPPASHFLAPLLTINTNIHGQASPFSAPGALTSQPMSTATSTSTEAESESPPHQAIHQLLLPHHPLSNHWLPSHQSHPSSPPPTLTDSQGHLPPRTLPYSYHTAQGQDREQLRLHTNSHELDTAPPLSVQIPTTTTTTGGQVREGLQMSLEDSEWFTSLAAPHPTEEHHRDIPASYPQSYPPLQAAHHHQAVHQQQEQQQWGISEVLPLSLLDIPLDLELTTPIHRGPGDTLMSPPQTTTDMATPTHPFHSTPPLQTHQVTHTVEENHRGHHTESNGHAHQEMIITPNPNDLLLVDSPSWISASQVHHHHPQAGGQETMYFSYHPPTTMNTPVHQQQHPLPSPPSADQMQAYFLQHLGMYPPPPHTPTSPLSATPYPQHHHHQGQEQMYFAHPPHALTTINNHTHHTPQYHQLNSNANTNTPSPPTPNTTVSLSHHHLPGPIQGHPWQQTTHHHLPFHPPSLPDLRMPSTPFAGRRGRGGVGGSAMKGYMSNAGANMKGRQVPLSMSMSMSTVPLNPALSMNNGNGVMVNGARGREEMETREEEEEEEKMGGGSKAKFESPSPPLLLPKE